MNSSNRRDYYRVHDRAYIEFERLDGNSTESSVTFHRHPACLELMNELHTLDAEGNRLLAHIPDKDRTVAALFRVMNKKVDMIARTLVMVDSQLPNQDYQEIDISEGGMAFHSAQTLEPGERIALKVVLIPAFLSFITTAEVVATDEESNLTPPDAKPHWVRVNFIELEDHQRQLLARHILKLQQHLRRREYNNGKG